MAEALGDDQPTQARPLATGLEPRFAPGSLLAGRYRVIYPLGRGGMGDVYRADDLRLGQPVALKFVRSDLSTSVRQRLYDEVRLGRQVSHPNVCRLYDIVEADGLTFIAMEYVDGEDLASLLARIGQLAPDKALDVARGLCAGLQAAHDRGVLHRDLKPANVMIDGRGRARLTDFGLAIEPRAAAPLPDTAGTPLYMSPEQLAGGEVTARSDVYSLGLVLYETVAGRRFFNARTLDELRSQHRAERLSRLGALSGQINPAFERLIAQCLEEDPQARPASARAVLALLPGGDPLEAAIAAGETPAPDIVAAAATVGDLRPAAAWGALLALLAGLAAVVWGSERLGIVPTKSPPLTPELLADRARQTLWSLGHRAAARDSSRLYGWDWRQIRHFLHKDRSPERFDHLRDAPLSPLLFFYRQSPSPLVAANRNASVERDDPPADVPGMAEVDLDPRGRLRRYLAVPPRLEAGGPWPDPDWSPLFQAAEFDPADFRPVASEWAAPVDSDRKAAWVGTYPGMADLAVRVEAAAYHGRLVWFELILPWAAPESTVPWVEDAGPAPVPRLLLAFLALVVPLGGVFLARHNLRLRRGDRKGAWRVALLVFVAYSLARLFRADHVPGFGEFWLMIKVVAYPMVWAGLVWILYMALEPYARRRWPRVLISWGRLLAGRFRDPMVGRDVLVGAAASPIALVVFLVAIQVPARLGQPPLPSWATFNLAESLTSWTSTAYRILVNVYSAALWSIIWLFVLVLLRIVLRRNTLALIAWCLVGAIQTVPANGPLFGVTVGLPFAVFELALLMRFGLLGYTSYTLVSFLLTELPLTFDASLIWAPKGFVVLALVAALGAYGFRTALAGKPALGGEWLET
ncbi:MAG TPA: serine/threonine-protein kinase [Vicinamibacteria bacterium]